MRTRASASEYYGDPATDVVAGSFHAHRLSGVAGGVKAHPGTCRRLFKSGFLACSKADILLESESA
jgi:hypothetical protein